MCYGQQPLTGLKNKVDESFDAWGQATGLKTPIQRSARFWQGKDPDGTKPKKDPKPKKTPAPTKTNLSQLSIQEQREQKY